MAAVQALVAGPFDKVIRMIQGLIVRLEEEAAGEVDLRCVALRFVASLSFPFLPCHYLSFPFLFLSLSFPLSSLSFPFLPLSCLSFPFLHLSSLSFPFLFLSSLSSLSSPFFLFPTSGNRTRLCFLGKLSNRWERANTIVLHIEKGYQ